MSARRAPAGAEHPSSRRPGSIPGRRAARRATALALCAAGLTAPTAARADDSGQAVQATTVGSSAQTSSATVGQLEASCPTYARPSYDPNQSFPSNATWAVGTLLTCLQPAIALTPNTSVIVGSAQLSYADLQTASDFADPTQDPVVFSDGTNLRFERPSRGAGDDPVPDSEVVQDPTPLQLTVFTGPSLAVTISASATSVTPGGQLSFTASVAGGQASDFSWDFSGGASDTTQQDPTVAFPADDGAGRYKVTVEATNPSTGAAGVATAEITVTGTPAAAATTTTATTTAPPQSTTATTPAGGRRGTGGTGSGHGGATPTTPTTPRRTRSTPTTSTPARTTSTPTRRTPAGSATGPRTTTTTQTTAAATTATSTVAPGRASGTGRRSTRSRHSRAHSGPRRRPRAPTRHRQAATASRATLVTGHLLADLTPVALSRSPLARPAPASPTRAGGSAASIAHAAPLTWPQLAGSLAVIAALLGLGAARELRARRR